MEAIDRGRQRMIGKVMIELNESRLAEVRLCVDGKGKEGGGVK